MLATIVKQVLQSSVARGNAASFAIKLTGAVLGFAMFALLSRYLEPAQFGALAMAFNAMSFLATISLAGQETLIIRSWGEYANRPPLARGIIGFSFTIVLAASLAAAAFVVLAWPLWNSAVPTSVVVAGCLFLMAQAMMQLTAHLTRVARGLVAAEFPREIVWRLVAFGSIVICHQLGMPVAATHFFLACAAGLAISTAWQLRKIVQDIPGSILRAQPARELSAWIPRSLRMWFSTLLDASAQFLEVIVVGIFLGPAAAGFYFVITRISSVFAMISAAGSTYATSRIGALFYSGREAELQEMLRRQAMLNVVLVGGALAVIVVFGGLLLGAFGRAYLATYPLLVLLASGTAFAALAGPAQHVLLLTGHEGAYARIIAFTVVLRFALIALLGHTFGLTGAVIASCVAALLTGTVLIFVCRSLVELDPSPLSITLRDLIPRIRPNGDAYDGASGHRP